MNFNAFEISNLKIDFNWKHSEILDRMNAVAQILLIPP